MSKLRRTTRKSTHGTDDVGNNVRMAKFWRKFLRLTRGRVPVLRALEVAQEEGDAALKDLLVSIRTQIDGGKSLAEAMEARPDAFSLSVRELIKTAEKTGAWDEILAEVADGLEDGTFD